MKHFSIWQWADYARGLRDDVDRPAMEAHLSSGCARCARMASLFRSVAEMAGGDAGYEPPEHAIRYAQAVFSVSRPEPTSLPRLVARLLHDSIREPLPAGIRAQDRLSRHALYEAGRYYLDLQVDQPLAHGPVTLVGQLADRKNPSTDTVVPVWLMRQKNVVASTLSNRFGEFQLEYMLAPDLRLHVPLREANSRLEIALNRLAPDTGRPASSTRRKSTRRHKAR